MANQATVQKFWNDFQYTDQKSYKSFLEYYEKMMELT